mgnify:CR=1 FL=1
MTVADFKAELDKAKVAVVTLRTAREAKVKRRVSMEEGALPTSSPGTHSQAMKRATKTAMLKSILGQQGLNPNENPDQYLKHKLVN